MSASIRILAIALLLLLSSTACEEVDGSLLISVGVVGLVLTDPSLEPQRVEVGTPDETFQVVEWEVTRATLVREDGATEDLLFGEPCGFIQTVRSLFNPMGRCSEGIVLRSTDQTGAQPDPTQVPVRLELTLAKVKVRRAVPEPLPANADYEGDRRANQSDNCPLLPNPDQADPNGNGFGDVCRDPETALLDSERDLVPDDFDNCVWYENTNQEDTMGVTAEFDIPDGIGDACIEQSIELNEELIFDGDDLPADLGLATGGLSFLVVDFTGAIEPNWIDGTITFHPEEVELCGRETSLPLALQGCDEL